jgi:hypothetical protein
MAPPLASAEGMMHRLMQISLFGIPLAGSQVQGRHRFAFCLQQPVAQRLRKQGVVAIPLTPLVQGDDE